LVVGGAYMGCLMVLIAPKNMVALAAGVGQSLPKPFPAGGGMSFSNQMSKRRHHIREIVGMKCRVVVNRM